MGAMNGAVYGAGYSRAQAEARRWPPTRIRTNIAACMRRLDVALVVGDRREAEACAGIMDGLTDVLLAPERTDLPTRGCGFQYRRFLGSPWESWNGRADERVAITDHHRQFIEHVAQGRCARITAVAYLLDWAALHPLLHRR